MPVRMGGKGRSRHKRSGTIKPIPKSLSRPEAQVPDELTASASEQARPAIEEPAKEPAAKPVRQASPAKADAPKPESVEDGDVYDLSMEIRVTQRMWGAAEHIAKSYKKTADNIIKALLRNSHKDFRALCEEGGFEDLPELADGDALRDDIFKTRNIGVKPSELQAVRDAIDPFGINTDRSNCTEIYTRILYKKLRIG